MTARRAVLVVNPTKVADAAALRRRVDRAFTEAGWERPQWAETTREDPGRDAAHRAAQDGADLVVACGGDGTVTACAEGLADTEVPLAILPAGTGNLLARNLDIPTDVPGALRVALHGGNRRLDLGMVDEHRFAVMAGIGFDAAVMADAPERLKRRMGWPAYLVSGLRHLRGPHMDVTVRLDGADALHRHARTVLIGNVGALQGGVPLLPDAEPDDGLLDVVIIAPRTVLEWLAVVVHILLRRGLRGQDRPDRRDRRLERHRARRIEVEAKHDEPRQVDGEVLPRGRGLVVEIDPGALIVRVPRSRARENAA